MIYSYYKHHKFDVILKNSELLSDYMNTSVFMSENYNKYDINYLLSNYQNKLHALLNSYLNSYDLTGIFEYLYPAFKIYNKYYFKNSILEILFLQDMLSNSIGCKNNFRNCRGKLDSKRFCAVNRNKRASF